jgi:2-polyprenyl-3-methyl-5-hydroxy-6-metoxy-1,4-benzoquinol methylase
MRCNGQIGVHVPIFPVDAVRNAPIDREVEVLLEELREEVASFPFAHGDLAAPADVLGVFDVARPRLNVLVAALRTMSGARGIDLGSGFGFLPVALRRCGVTAIAAERDPDLCQFAAACAVEVQTYRLGAGSPPPAGSPFEFAVLSEVLEHLKLPPVRVLQEVAALLRPGGRFLLTTPNVARLAHIQALASGENFLEPFDESIPPGDDPTDHVEHVREYSVREVVDAAEGAGFAVDRVEMTGWGADGYELLPNPYANQITVLHATL